MAYNFHYTPTGTGVISGKEVLEQTEDAINDLGNTAISGVEEALDKAEQALTNSQNAVDDAQSALNTAGNADENATTALNTVNNLSGTVTSLGNRVTTAEGNITNLQGRMTTAESGISGLNTRMGTAEGNITTLQSNVSTAQATANSAQQTANTARQQSYILRYSSSSITDNSTIAYSTIDNTDNIKTSDKIIDVDGKIFSIVSVDTANQTVTVGAVLLTLALDANVMHLSGDETASGIKSFTGTRTEFKRTNGDGVLFFNNGSFTKGSAPNAAVNICRKYYGDATSIGSVLGYSAVMVSDNGNKTTYQFYCIDNTAGSTTRTTLQMNYDKSLVGTDAQYFYFTGSLHPSADNSYSLGNSSNKWKTFNGINPGALSLPDLSAGVDISGYLTNAGTTTPSEFTPSVNGWIVLKISADSPAYIRVYSVGGLDVSSYSERNEIGSTSGGSYTRFASLIVPCINNDKLNIILMPGLMTIISAKFYPCQGNV